MRRVLIIIACVLLVYNIQAQTVIRKPVNAETVMGLDTTDMVLTTDRNQTILGYKNFTNGILIGSDVNLYRSAANSLKTDDNFTVGSSLTSNGYSYLVGRVNHYAHIAVLNKSGSGFLEWFTRNTSGTEVVGDLNYIGSITSPYAATYGTTAGTFNLSAGGANSLIFKTNGVPRWYVNASGIMLPYAANTYDIGTAAYAVKDIYLDGSINIGGDIVISRQSADRLLINDEVRIGSYTLFDTYGRINLLNKAGSGWLNVFSRNVAGTEAVADLTYIGNITMPYASAINTSSGNLTIGTNGGSSLIFKTNNTPRWYVSTSGAFSPYTANTYDIGDATYKVKDIYTGGFYYHSTTASITASTTQTQGQQPLTTEWNEVATVGNANDVVTLPTAAAGKECFIVNTGANTLQIFPASGDNLGAGVDTSTTLAAGSSITFAAVNDTNWYSK